MRKPDPSKRAAILSAARARFYRYGVQKTTMQEIATDTGMSVGTLYLYFRNKDEILSACTVVFEDEHRREAQAILDSDAPADARLRLYILSRFRANKRTREGSDHASEIARHVLRLVPSRIEAEARLMYETLLSLLTLGRSAGLFPSATLPDDVEIFLYSIAYFFPLAGKEPPVPPDEPTLTKVIDWFLLQWQKPPS